MNIEEFIAQYHNYPVLFVGTGLSLRYLKVSYSWDTLLKKIANDFTDNSEYYLDIKAECMQGKECDYECVATRLEQDFNKYLKENRHGKFEKINDLFYENMKKGVNISRFKLYIADILSNMEIQDSVLPEIDELKKARKNISSIITTNYDCMVEKLFSFHPLIGNDILMSNPYGSVYKIHGCVSQPEKIIITKEDYDEFKYRYELIRAQLLSLFIHNPIIFIGYNIGDKNIKDILKTIFSYVDYTSDEAKKIRNNFLLIEYDCGNMETEVVEHDIDVEGFETIRINKLKTDNFTAVYQALSKLILPVSAMDIRKVQNVVREIYEGGNIQVSITEDLDELNNSDKVLAIGSAKTIKYVFLTTSEMMIKYFDIIEEENYPLLKLLDKQKIQKKQFFPIFAFSKIYPDINRVEELKTQQKENLLSTVKKRNSTCQGDHRSPLEVENDPKVPKSYKIEEMICSTMSGSMDLEELKSYLRNYPDKRSTQYRKLLCAYDLKNYE